MAWYSRFLSRKATQLTYEQIANLIDSGGRGGRGAGVNVTDKTAIQVATVLACVRTIADGCSTPALHVFRELPDGTRQRAVNIPEYRLLGRRPNEWQTSLEWRRMMTLHAALTGMGLSIIVRGDNRRVRELLPVPPGQWALEKRGRYDLIYRCWDEFGLIGEFAPSDVFLLPGLQWEWARHMDAVKLAASAVGLTMATERSQAAFHANGLRPSGLYSVEGTLTKEQHDRLTEVLKKNAGEENTGLPLILDRAASWVGTAMSGVDAQHVETRRLQIEEICRNYGVFPIMIGHSDKAATFASTEAFFGAHLKHTLTPWHRTWTQRLDETLLDGSGPLFAEFDTRYLTAGSMKDRAAYASVAILNGLLSPNEWREAEGLDPRPGGDTYLQPLNTTTSGTSTTEGNGDDDPTAPQD